MPESTKRCRMVSLKWYVVPADHTYIQIAKKCFANLTFLIIIMPPIQQVHLIKGGFTNSFPKETLYRIRAD